MSEKKIVNIKEERTQVYEIGYLLVSSIPAEKVAGEIALLKEILSNNDAIMIAEEAPELITLAYTMTKKIGASNHKFDQGYFGWFKFELNVKNIELVKKAFEANTNMLRMLLITTVKEGTYLGKKFSPSISEAPILNTAEIPVPASSVEEIDKSIDEMVKEA